MRWRGIIFAALALIAAPLAAQTSPSAPAPMFDNVDANGVDVTTGQFRFSMTEGTIGSGPGAVSLARYWGDGVWRDNWSGGLYSIGSGSSSITHIDFGGVSDSFTLSGGVYTTREGNGSTLVYDSGTQTYIYKTATGTTYVFQYQQSGKYLANQVCPTGANSCNRPLSITEPTGLVWTINWDEAEKCMGGGSECVTKFYYRFAGVSSSAGYGFGITYQSNDPGAVNVVPPADWYVRIGASFGSTAGSCTGVCPSMAYSTSTPLTLTDAMGRVWRFTMTGSNLTGIKRPGSASADTTTITYSSGQVSQVVRDGVTTNYSYSTSGGALTTTATDANSNTVQIETATSVGRPRKVTDQLSRVTQQTYDGSYRPLVTTWPEGNTLTRVYDARSNVTSTTLAPKSTSSLSNIVTGATFANTCPGAACNKPDTTTDARSHVTNYTYDGTTGQLTSVKLPPPATSGVRPETRYGYAATAGVSMPITVSACRTTTSCAGGADEVKTSISYNANLLPTSVTSGGGDGVLTASVALTYTAAGDRATVDGPLPGTADITHYYYNADREPTGIIGPDPDDAGALKNRATDYARNADGQVYLIQQGTANPDGSGYVTLQMEYHEYDGNARLVKVAPLNAANQAKNIIQYEYDGLGRLACTATRMNPATWPSLPGACTLATTGSDGPDRIVKTTYDAASQVTKTTSAYATADQADDATQTYTANGKAETLTDANGNKTTYVYDGFDRLDRQRYPSPTTPGVSSTTDYESWGYDAASNATSWRKRDGRVFGLAFDDLNRPAVKTVPDGCAPIQVGPCPGSTATRDVYYAYDLLGHPLYARFDSASGEGIDFAWDALGRKTGETTTLDGVSRPLTSQYDLAGGRTRLTHPDGAYFSFARDTLDRLYQGYWTISGVGTVPFYAVTYDDLGRRTGTNQASSYTDYGYDGVSRLASLGQRFAGGTGNVSTGFAYNPANQISSQTRDNDAYAFAQANQDVDETPNGLNQLVTQGSANLSYDAAGSLVSDGTNSYGYDAENRLISGSAYGVALRYDPLGRLWETASATFGTTRFLTDGAQVAAEYDGATGAIRRRFMFDDDSGAPVLQDEGGALNCGGTRFYQNDERGSAIAIADCFGNRTAIDAYDDYGVPSNPTTAIGTAGRYRYTGQAYIPELGMYYYKARIYAPGLGRFMQSDPVGYGGGMNLYAYVRGDPVNLNDPLGLKAPENPCAKNPLACGSEYGIPDGWQVWDGYSQGTCRSPLAGGGYGSEHSCIATIGQTGSIGVPGQNEGGGGGGGMGGRLTDPIPAIKPVQTNACSQAATEPGVVATIGIGGTFVDVVGATGGFGTFTNLQTGTTGYYISAGPAAGLDVSGGGQGGTYSSMSAFLGGSVGFSGTAGNVSGSFSGNLSGAGGTVSAALGAGAAISATYTTTFGCKIGG